MKKFWLFFLLKIYPVFAESKYKIKFSESFYDDKKTEISGDSGTELIANFIKIFYTYGASIIGIICVAIIVASGVQMIAGGASQENYTNGQNRILQALLSLVLLFLSALILKSINPGFFR